MKRNLICLFISLFLLAKSEPQDLFSYSPNNYNCIDVVITESSHDFQEKLKTAVLIWQQKGANGVWLTIPIELSALIPQAVNEGFIFHHAKEDKLVLTKWISDKENYLPAYATRSVGAWALVINDHNEILVIKEKYN